ncbi:Atg14 domain-containing protein [Shewanella aquimarina]|uniref:Atg14 domain-containing protein n=1 Tax=Shewanella aquimarina TaxID=260365 RepID=UPI0020148D8D|nr:Atg14 domain-containing protein [Shewanella aquimarina]MCL2908501.1 Atg14 domain-containing protein [Shewanella aquimarina]
MNVLGINPLGAQSAGPTDLSSIEVRSTNSPQAPQVQNTQSQPVTDKVSLSEEGRQALADATGKALRNNDAAKAANAQKAEQEVDEGQSQIDKKIKELKQKLEELKLELQALQGDDSEAAKQARKQLQDQIAVLSNQLMSLLSAKEKQDQSQG